jgi:hypothetical protein
MGIVKNNNGSSHNKKIKAHVADVVFVFFLMPKEMESFVLIYKPNRIFPKCNNKYSGGLLKFTT